MAGVLKRDIDDILASAVFRANPQYELVLFDRLPAAQQAMFADLVERPNFYGILRPGEGSGLSIKVVTRETALLCLTLRDPAPLPRYARPVTGDDRVSVVRLVLDQILQVRHADRFVSGADAFGLFYDVPADRPLGTRLQQLSIAALQYAQALPLDDVGELSARLYGYYRVPLSARWREVYPSTARVRERLGVTAGGACAALLDGSWIRAGRSSDRDEEATAAGWLSWTSRDALGDSAGLPSTYKLYISPMPEVVERAFEIAVRALTGTAVLQLKIGADAEGILRPDKMVAYFRSRDDLHAASDRLVPQLAGLPAQGVPFTAEITADGLLSWGADPPAASRLLNWQPHESWRLWLTNRLANALLTARRDGQVSGALEPWQYALERLELEGVDTASWVARDPARAAGPPSAR